MCTGEVLNQIFISKLLRATQFLFFSSTKADILLLMVYIKVAILVFSVEITVRLWYYTTQSVQYIYLLPCVCS